MLLYVYVFIYSRVILAIRSRSCLCFLSSGFRYSAMNREWERQPLARLEKVVTPPRIEFPSSSCASCDTAAVIFLVVFVVFGISIERCIIYIYCCLCE